MSEQAIWTDPSGSINLYHRQDRPYIFARVRFAPSRYKKFSTKQTSIEEARRFAERKLIEIQFKLENDIPLDVVKFADIAQEVIEELKEEKINKAEELKDKGLTTSITQQSYITALETYLVPILGDIPIHKLSDADLERYKHERRVIAGEELSRSTIGKHRVAYNRVIRKAKQKHYLEKDAPAFPLSGKEAKPRASFTKAEYMALMEHLREKMGTGHSRHEKDLNAMLYYLMMFLFQSGMRGFGTSVRSLRWRNLSQVKTAQGTTIIVEVPAGYGKTSKGKAISVPVRDIMKQKFYELRKLNAPHNSLDDYIWLLPSTGQVPRDQAVTKAFARVLDDCGMRRNDNGVRSIYSARHSFIEWALLDGKSVYDVATVTHTSVSMIESYYSRLTGKRFADSFGRSEYGTYDEFDLWNEFEKTAK